MTTDYAKHIVALETLLSQLGPSGFDSLTAAIEIMRAATPKSPEEKLVSFRRVAAEIMADEHDTSENIVDALFEASAAARAERHVEICFLQKDVADHKAQLSAAQAEIERLRAEYDQDHKMLVDVAHALQTKLTERDAEIERLRAAMDEKEHECAAFVVLHSNCVDARDALQTKLENLRTAAERLKNVMASHHTPGRVGIGELMNKQGEALWDAFCASIEASRT